MLLKQSTTRNVPVLMVLSSDHITGATGLTLTITASKDGASFASISPTVTELANGWYSLALTTTHTNTLGALALHITGSGADPSDVLHEVVVELPGLVSSGTGTGQISLSSGVVKSNLSQILGTAITESVAGYLSSGFKKLLDVATPIFTVASVIQTGDSYARLGAPAGASISADIAALPDETENADALLNRDMSAVTVTNSRSPINALRRLRNRVAAATGVGTVYKEDDTTAAWTANLTSDAAAEPITEVDPT